MNRSLRVLSFLAVSLGAALSGTAQPLPRTTPEVQGISSAALLGFVEAAEKKIDALHSMMVMRHGQAVAEGWWVPYAPQEPHRLFSLSKSFTPPPSALRSPKAN